MPQPTDIDPDLTVRALATPGQRLSMQLYAGDNGVLAGQRTFEALLQADGHDAHATWQLSDGDRLRAGSSVAALDISCAGLASVGQSALDMLSLMSGIAGAAREYVERVKGTHTQITLSPHALPGLREQQRQAAQCGGVMISDKDVSRVVIGQAHCAAAGGLQPAIAHARATLPESELVAAIDALEPLEIALEAQVDGVILVDLASHVLARAVNMADAHRRRFRRNLCIEATGHITLTNVREIADTGVDRIAVPALTRQLRAPGFSLHLA